MSRYIVTGGAGFIGSHLSERLLADGHSVVAVDNLLTGQRKNLEGAARDSRFEFVQADICEKFPDLGKADGVFHMASPASPIDFIPLAIPILRVGSIGTFHVMDYARNNASWVLTASTSEIYGDPEEHPQKEAYFGNVNPIGIRGVYDEAKRFAESLTTAYRRRYNLETSIVRIFNTYGPRMRPNDGRVIPNFVRNALQGKSLELYGGGSQTRSLCYVTDLVDGLVRFAEKKPPEPINLGNDNEMSIRTLAESILKLTGSKSALTDGPLPEGDPKRRCPDISRAKEVLGWKPVTSLNDGLKKTIDSFRKML